jgi:hypothetical protein
MKFHYSGSLAGPHLQVMNHGSLGLGRRLRREKRPNSRNGSGEIRVVIAVFTIQCHVLLGSLSLGPRGPLSANHDMELLGAIFAAIRL